MSQNSIEAELKCRFSNEQLKRIKKELNLIFSTPPDDLPKISLEFKQNKKKGLIINVS